MFPTLVHVHPTPSGDWEVRPDDREAPVSTHPTADEAERAAHAVADRDGGVVVLRDRYSRVHVSPPGHPSRTPARA